MVSAKSKAVNQGSTSILSGPHRQSSYMDQLAFVSVTEAEDRRFLSRLQRHLFMDQRVQKIQQMMRDNLHRELSLSRLAQSVNLSVWRLCHIFRSEADMSPIKYLRLLRMEKAKHLLETTFLSIKEIGHNVGLNDESHFVRDFKKAYGVPPTVYRGLSNSGHLSESDNVIKPHSELRDEMAKTAKRLILISLNTLAYLVSSVEGLV